MEETDSSSLFDKSLESNGDNHSFSKKINTLSDKSDAIEETQTKIRKKDKRQKKFFHCIEDSCIPLVIIYNTLLMIICPKSGREEKVTFGEEYKNYIYCSDNLNVDNYIKCQEPGHNEKKFKYYCFECKRNLCKLCLQNKICSHKDENRFIFKQNLSKYKKIAEDIQKKINSLKLIDTPTKLCIETSLNNFNEFKYNYSYFKNMDVFNDYLNKIIKKEIIKKYN